MYNPALTQPYILIDTAFVITEKDEHLCIFEGNLVSSHSIRLVPFCNNVWIISETSIQEFKLIKEYIDIELDPGNYTIIIRDYQNETPDVNALLIRDMIIEEYGDIALDDLCGATGYCNRHINRIFTATFGYGPKTFAKAMRLANVVNEIIKEPNRSNLEFITNSGYSDQAHFQREFKQFFGETPREFIKRL